MQHLELWPDWGLNVEHRPSGYILGALPLSYLALVSIRWIASLLPLLWRTSNKTLGEKVAFAGVCPMGHPQQNVLGGTSIMFSFLSFKFSIPTLQKVPYSGSMLEASGLVSE